MALKLIPKNAPPREPAGADPLTEAIDLVIALQPKAASIKKKISELQAEMKAFGEAEKRVHELIRADERYDETDEDDTFRVNATLGHVDVGKKGSKREIVDMKGVRTLLGEKAFMELAKVNLSDLDAYLTAKEQETVVETKRGDRSIKIVPKAKIIS